MCNPRRIRIQGLQNLTESWHEEILRSAQASAELTGEASVVEDMRALLGTPAYAQFVRCLGSDDTWVEMDGTYHVDVVGGSVAFDPGSGEIELNARLSRLYVESAEARREASGTVSSSGSVEVTRTFDPYRSGRSETEIRREAQQAADIEAAQLARTRLHQARDRAVGEARANLRAAEDEVEAEAQRAARQKLEAAAEDRRIELVQEAAAELDRIREDCMSLINRSVGRAYRESILAYAEAQRATNLRVVEREGVIEIEFEL